jgi:diguanylate cyclase (GGDEF)-like protein
MTLPDRMVEALRGASPNAGDGNDNRPNPRARLCLFAAAALVVLFNASLLLWTLVKPGSHNVFAAVDNLAQVAGAILVFPFCFGWRLDQRGQSSPRDWARLWAPRLIGISVLADVIAQAIWNYYSLVLNQASPFPSWADAAYLTVDPLLLAGILLMLRGAAPAASRARLGLDGLMVMTGAFTFSWYFVLGPTFYQGQESFLAKVVGTAYPLMDLLLIGCLVLLALRSKDRVLRPVIGLLSLGIASYVLGDTIFDIQTLHGSYATGEWIDVTWPLGDMLLVLGAGLLRFTSSRATDASTQESDLPASGDASEPDAETLLDDTDHARLWPTLLPYALVPAVGGLLLYMTRTSGDELYRPGVIAGSIILIALVLARQLLTIVENARLSRRLRINNRALLKANRQLEALATTDPLTGLPNHRALMSSLDRELERALRYRRPCSLIFFDVDHFKALNDTLGHPAGDGALNEIGLVAGRVLRGIDILGRLGGEEFLAILPDTDQEGAALAAERVRAAVAGHGFLLSEAVNLTCSLGVATYPDDAGDRDELIELADRAMYAAKTLGRNQVRSISDAGLPGLAGGLRWAGSREEITLLGTVEALGALVDARDAYTGEHTRAVAGMSVRIALALGLDRSETKLIDLAAQLHDIGKVAVPDAVLLTPGRLTPEQWALIRTHPVVGADVVRHVPALSSIAHIILSHHERWDGKGYPDGLQGQDIPLGARIVAVADAFDAMTTDRPYRPAMSREDALAEVQRCSASQFDPTIVEALTRVLESDMGMEQASA